MAIRVSSSPISPGLRGAEPRFPCTLQAIICPHPPSCLSGAPAFDLSASEVILSGQLLLISASLLGGSRWSWWSLTCLMRGASSAAYGPYSLAYMIKKNAVRCFCSKRILEFAQNPHLTISKIMCYSSFQICSSSKLSISPLEYLATYRIKADYELKKKTQPNQNYGLHNSIVKTK